MVYFKTRTADGSIRPAGRFYHNITGLDHNAYLVVDCFGEFTTASGKLFHIFTILSCESYPGVAKIYLVFC